METRPVLAAVCCAAGVAAGQQFPMQVIAYQGSNAPDGSIFFDIRAPEVSPSGEVVFFADSHSGGNGWQYSMYRWRLGAGLERLVGTGDPTPGIEGSTFQYLGAYPRAISPDQTWFTAVITTEPYNSETDDTVWGMRAGQPWLVAREGSAAPSLGPAVYGQYFGPLSPGPAGSQMVFGNMLRGDGVDDTNDGALFYHENGRTDLLLREGVDFSSHTPGVYVSGLTRSSMITLTMDREGVVAFDTGLEGPNVHPEDNRAILMGRPGALEIAVRRGQPAPGVGDGLNFGPLYYTSINEGGRLAFAADLNRDGMTSRDGAGIWVGTPDDLQLQIRDGDNLPGVDGGPSIYAFKRVMQNDRGDWCAIAETDRFHRDERAVLMGPSGDLPITVAYSGMAAPGFGDGVTFSDESFSFLDPVVSPDGAIAFTASLEGPGMDNTNNVGLWARTTAGELRSVLQIGSDLEVAPGDVRTVEWVRLRESGTTRNWFDQSFGAGGLLAASVDFTDATSANVLFVIPAPGTMTGGVPLILLSLRRRRGRD